MSVITDPSGFFVEGCRLLRIARSSFYDQDIEAVRHAADHVFRQYLENRLIAGELEAR